MWILSNFRQRSNGCCSEHNKEGGELLEPDSDVSCLTTAATEVNFYPEFEIEVDFFAGPLVWPRESSTALPNTGFNFCQPSPALLQVTGKFTNDQSQTEWIVKFPDGVNTRHCIAATNQKRGKLIKMLYIIVANSRPIFQLSDVGLRQQKHITRATIKPLSRFVISQLRCKQLAVASGPHPITGLHQH